MTIESADSKHDRYDSNSFTEKRRFDNAEAVLRRPPLTSMSDVRFPDADYSVLQDPRGSYWRWEESQFRGRKRRQQHKMQLELSSNDGGAL